MVQLKICCRFRFMKMSFIHNFLHKHNTNSFATHSRMLSKRVRNKKKKHIKFPHEIIRNFTRAKQKQTNKKTSIFSLLSSSLPLYICIVYIICLRLYAQCERVFVYLLCANSQRHDHTHTRRREYARAPNYGNK